MAANFTSGVGTTQAWHGLMQVVQPGQHTRRELFALAGADFTASDDRVYRPDPSTDNTADLRNRFNRFMEEVRRVSPEQEQESRELGSIINERLASSSYRAIDGYKAIVNDVSGETLSIQSNEYHIIQNTHLLSLAEALPESCQILSVVVLAGGRRVCFSASMPDLVGEVVPNDILQLKFSGINAFDGLTSFTVLLDPTRIVCDNTCGYAQYGADQATGRGMNRIIRINHRSGADEIIRQVPHAIDFARGQFAATLEQLQAMAARACDVELFRSILEETFADELRTTINDVRGDKTTARPRRLTDITGFDEMCNNFAGDLIGNDIPGVQGTVWGAMNSISQFFRHQYAVDGKNGEARRFASLQGGVNQRRVQSAFRACLAATRT
jgi:hypothetical protein